MDNRDEILQSLKAIEANQQRQLDGLRESQLLHLTWLILRQTHFAVGPNLFGID
jgi:hypothetical protein